VTTSWRLPMCHNLMRRLGDCWASRLACKEVVRSRPRCYQKHRIGCSILQERFCVAQVARQKEGLLHPLAIVSAYLALSPQRDLKVNTLGGKVVELPPICKP
jgi:hypothetical protein